MHARRNYIILGLAVIALLTAVGLEHPFFSINDDPSRSVVFNPESLVSLCKEVAFALIVALIISVGIEEWSRKQDREAAQAMRRELAEDVFRGVFSRHFRKEYIDTVVSTNLQPSVVRTKMSIDYSLASIARDEIDGTVIDFDRYVILRVRNTYILENISPKPITEAVSVNIPRRGGALTKFSGVRTAKIGTPGRPDEIDVPTHIYEKNRHEWNFSYQAHIQVGGILEVTIEYDLVKDISDSEVWVTVYPTLEADITLTNQVPGLELGLSPRTASPLRALVSPDSGLPGRWRLEGPMLPHNSVVLWWRPKT